MSQPSRVLVVGDPYMPAGSYAEALAGLGGAVTVTSLEIGQSEPAPPRTPSAGRLREYAGDPADVERAVAGHEVLVVHGAPVTAEALDAGPLRLVCCARGGPVNVDVAAATQRGIPVANTPGRNAEAVAELTLAFALLLIRGVPRAARYLSEGGALAESTFEGGEFLGREAPGTTLGLVGLGHVGREVAARARALGFTVIACDPAPPRAVPPGVAMAPLDTLLAESDVVSLHARATAENRHLLGATQFARMRPGACLINTARETLVDEAALREALLRGHLGGAALDVVERPPVGQRHPLLDLPNVIITPHVGGATEETLRRGARQAVAAVADFVAGRPPVSLVNPEVLSGSGAPSESEGRGAAWTEERGTSDEGRRRLKGAPMRAGNTAMTGRYLLAIDAGTGSCRAVLFTEQGRQVASSLREWAHPEPPDAPGGQDFDVEANWRLISTCIRNVLREAGAEGRDVIAVAATSMREGVVLYDGSGQEIWACPNVDSRSAQEAADLISEGAAERIYAEAGDWVSITTPARLRWLARHRPGVLEAARGLGMLSDWITFRLARVRVTEPSCGSSSGMFTLAERHWSQAIARVCGISPDILPPVVDPGTVVGAVTERAAEQTGLRAGTPVVAGGADTQLGLLGAGAGAGEYTVVAGTFWQNTVLLDKPLIDPGARLRTLCHVLPGQWMIEGIGFYCGMSMRWFRDAFCDAEAAAARARGVDPYMVMEEAAAQVPAGSRGVLAIMSNLMNARRWVHASPSFLGFDLGDPATSGRSACIRAIEEAAAYVVRGHRDIIADLTDLAIGELVFTGGAAKGHLWPQIIADVLAVPVHVPVVRESSALGAALCAGLGVGTYASLTELEPELRRRAATFEPDPSAVAVYDERYQTWRQVYRRMIDLCDDGLLSPLWRAAGA